MALGGGVVGDLAGFAAAIYQRGMPFVQVPTTLLAQVDSSVGGKTAVNHPLGKNMIGAFWQPRGVLIDTDCLRDAAATASSAPGSPRSIKYGAIRDAAFFDWLERSIDRAARARRRRRSSTRSCESCRIKAEIVAADERETGERALLNFGHTFGHAIETATGYGTWLHGEAVGDRHGARGAAVDARVRARRATTPARVEALVARAGLPVAPPQLAARPLARPDVARQEGRGRRDAFRPARRARPRDRALGRAARDARGRAGADAIVG